MLAVGRGARGGLLVLLLLAAPAPAAADECGAPNMLFSVPPPDARAVPPNAVFSAYYAVAAAYENEDVTLIHVGALGGGGVLVDARFDPTEGRLSFTPPDGLVPGDDYTVVWPKLRGNTAAKGTKQDATVTVGTELDTAAPSFGGVTAVSWNVERDPDACTGSAEERLGFDLTLGPAEDDGGTESLTVVVFQTSGPNVVSGPIPVRLALLPEPGVPLHVGLPTTDAVGRICFAAIVRDLTDKISDSASQEVCVHTRAPPFFQGCAISGAEGLPTTGWAAPVGLLVLALGRRRR